MRNSLDYAGLAQLCARSPIMRKIMRAHNRIIQPSLDQVCRGRSKPGYRIVGSGTKDWLTTGADVQTSDHWAFMSTGVMSDDQIGLRDARRAGDSSIIHYRIHVRVVNKLDRRRRRRVLLTTRSTCRGEIF